VLSNWPVFLRGVKRTVAFLEDERIFDAARLPTDMVIPILTALWGIAPDGGHIEGQARIILRRYMWRAFFTNRYEPSTTSRSLADFLQLRSLIASGDDISGLILFDEGQHPLPQAEQLVASGWPERKDRLARAILALALREGGQDLADGSSVSRENLTKREYHHLYPVAHLGRQDIADTEAYRSLNCGLVYV
jgi:hypothetical protein